MVMHDKKAEPTVSQPIQNSYLLRYWQTSEDSPYRFMLKSVRTGKQVMFRDLAGLVAFLQTKTDGDAV